MVPEALTPTDLRDLGEIIRTHRSKAGLTQRDLAIQLGIAPAFLNDIEHGRRRLIVERIDKLPDQIRAPLFRWMMDWHRKEIATLQKMLHRHPTRGLSHPWGEPNDD